MRSSCASETVDGTSLAGRTIDDTNGGDAATHGCAPLRRSDSRVTVSWYAVILFIGVEGGHHQPGQASPCTNGSLSAPPATRTAASASRAGPQAAAMAAPVCAAEWLLKQSGSRAGLLAYVG